MMSRKLSSLFPLWLLVVVLMAALPAVAEEVKTDPANADQTAVASACQRCGDGYCARSCENERTCPADCAPQTKVSAARCGKCGDGTCVRQCGETPESCPIDCGVPSESAATETKPVECDAAKKPQPKKE